MNILREGGISTWLNYAYDHRRYPAMATDAVLAEGADLWHDNGVCVLIYDFRIGAGSYKEKQLGDNNGRYLIHALNQ
jgi:hypothetical protein